ncbi:11776_t:CDS:2, partial [Dentiscutata heterogama]
AKRYDNQNFITCNIQKKYGVQKTEKNLGVVACKKQAIYRSTKKRTNSVNKAESSTKSRQTKKIKKIENSQELTDALAKFDLEKEEKVLFLNEKKIELEEWELKLEKEKLEILKLK